METVNRSRSPLYWGRVGAALVAAAVAVSGVAAAVPAAGNPPSDIQRLRDRAEIEELTYCYAEATDAIGRGQVEVGRALYQKCFTKDAVIGVYFPTDDPNGPPGLSSGPSAWADIVDDVFTTSGYLATQHLMGNVRIDIQGKTATMSTYLNATHVIDPVGAIDLANGTYEDVVVRTPQGWKIAQRTLRLITFLRVESP
ncbi:nuclear transport factor 2 family protein [Polyangium aurulentum]|uniref:nuclear transport factor 2 family protein n=1 Tax=Polyangium aurulentum TaxID=2567896 RepID=UPI0010AE3374|nr:nuclear transport factor 2 family protein [Polyangium aurulentum]UQA57275.1 nuclear transport factor 2 family protein [Polyangium aurulentum]